MWLALQVPLVEVEEVVAVEVVGLFNLYLYPDVVEVKFTAYEFLYQCP